MARICPLFSGSSGNSTYISTPAGAILIDAGVTYKRLIAAMEAAGGVENLCAVAVTHTHVDHIRGLKLLLKNHPIPLLASEQTFAVLSGNDVLPAGARLIVAEKQPVAVGDFSVQRVPTRHDSPGSGGYVVTLEDGRRVAVCTDLGIVTQEVRTALTGCEAVLIESNHDIAMLKNGPYPPQTKQRILSDHGHLSNVACAAELPELLRHGTKRFVLGHLSRHNNLPMLARSAARAALMDIGAEEERDYLLTVAAPEGNGVLPF